MINKGFSLVEVLVTVAIFALLFLSMSEFSSNAFNIMYKQGKQAEMSDQLRSSSGLISEIINKSYYIFPAGKEITISGPTKLHAKKIDTDNAVAVLIFNNESNGKYYYYFKAFYLAGGNLYRFSSSDTVSWAKDTCPASNITSVTGKEKRIATDISMSSLSYSLNYKNGDTDSKLKGSITPGVDSNDEDALIKGISWELTFNSNISVKIEGMSNNVPRYL